MEKGEGRGKYRSEKLKESYRKGVDMQIDRQIKIDIKLEREKERTGEIFKKMLVMEYKETIGHNLFVVVVEAEVYIILCPTNNLECLNLFVLFLNSME